MFDKAHLIFYYLKNHSSTLQLGLFLFLFFVGWNIEIYTSQKDSKKKWKHALFNIKFLLADAILLILLGLFFIKIMQWTQEHHFGILYLFPSKSSSFLLFIVVFIFLDVGEYFYHVTMHKVKCFWGFHAIHHSDQVVDVSTVFREHPMESVIRNCFALLWVFLSGTVFWMFFIHLLVQTFFVIFSHSNIRLPEKINTILGLVFITPNIHQVHHHYKQPYTDKNYGDILSIWDRMFGTFCVLPYDKIVFGVDCFMEEKKEIHFVGLLLRPFKRIKNKVH